MPKTLPNSIKSMAFSYCQCPLGDLHTGQVLNLVCVDSSCTKRGLICPVCRMSNHEEHQILPLKIFLDEIKKLFMENDTNDSLNNLSDFLRSLQNSRRQLLKILKQATQQIAKELKEIEQTIQSNYISIRRNVLAQSSISTKFPNFIDNLRKKSEKSPYAMQEQFQKYSSLIKFQNNLMTISDKSKKLVEDYSKLPPQVQVVLNQQIATIKQSFRDSILCKSPAQQTQVLAHKAPAFKFSTTNKSSQIFLKDDNKKAYTNDQISNLGVVYVEGAENQAQKTITFKITTSNSGSIILGVGDSKKDKETAFFFNLPLPNVHFIASANGYNQFEEDESEQKVDELVFDEEGAQIVVSLNTEQNEVLFQKKANNTKRKVDISGYSGDKKNLQFFVVLAESDEVQIVDS